MKTAIIYAGAMRSFDQTARNHAWFLWRHFPGADFFCATHDDADFEKVKLMPEGTVVSKFKQPEMIAPKECPTKWTPGKPYMHEPFAISVGPTAVMGQLWILRQAWGLMEACGKKYDRIVRVRPDLWFHSMETAPLPAWSEAYVPWWGSFGGVNDRFAILGRAAAEVYFRTYDRLNDFISDGAPLHPETLIKLSLDRSGCFVHDGFGVEFATLRTTGEFRSPEVFPGDIARRAAYLAANR